MKITLFGQLADVTGSSYITEQDVSSTGMLVEKLHARYPELQKMKYVIAVDQQLINSDTALTSHSAVALLPPFSGG